MKAKTVNGIAMHYEEAGGGLPVVLLHGFPLDSRIWTSQRDALKDRFRVIVPDLRGFGKTAFSDSFTLEALADDVHALLAELGALPCVLGGLSMGGYVAIAYAKKYPSDLKGLMLIDTRAEADSPEGKEARTKMIALVREKGAPAVADAMLPRLLAPDALNNRPALVKELRDIIEACPPATIEHALVAMRDRPDRTADLASIAVPTLIIVGEHDAITPVALAETMNRGIPNSKLLVVKGSGHMSNMEKAEVVNQGLTEFVTTIEGRNV